MKRFSAILILLATILASSVGCARKPDDAKISSDIQSRFSLDSGLSSKQLTAQASNGVVTISGFVDNDAQRTAAALQAASVSGVKEVVNNLQVGSAETAAANICRPRYEGQYQDCESDDRESNDRKSNAATATNRQANPARQEAPSFKRVGRLSLDRQHARRDGPRRHRREFPPAPACRSGGGASQYNSVSASSVCGAKENYH